MIQFFNQLFENTNTCYFIHYKNLYGRTNTTWLPIDKNKKVIPHI